MTIINQPLIVLTDEQVKMLAEAIRDGRAIVVSGEPAEGERPGIVKALPVRAEPLRLVAGVK